MWDIDFIVVCLSILAAPALPLFYVPTPPNQHVKHVTPWNLVRLLIVTMLPDQQYWIKQLRFDDFQNTIDGLFETLGPSTTDTLEWTYVIEYYNKRSAEKDAADQRYEQHLYRFFMSQGPYASRILTRQMMSTSDNMERHQILFLDYCLSKFC